MTNIWKNVKKSQNLIVKTANSLLNKKGKYMKIHFTKVDIQVANNYMERCSTSLTTREM